MLADYKKMPIFATILSIFHLKNKKYEENYDDRSDGSNVPNCKCTENSP